MSILSSKQQCLRGNRHMEDAILHSDTQHGLSSIYQYNTFDPFYSKTLLQSIL